MRRSLKREERLGENQEVSGRDRAAAASLEKFDLTEHLKDVKPVPSITCPHCGRKSFHPMDIQFRFCGICSWHDHPVSRETRQGVEALNKRLWPL